MPLTRERERHRKVYNFNKILDSQFFVEVHRPFHPEICAVPTLSKYLKESHPVFLVLTSLPLFFTSCSVRGRSYDEDFVHKSQLSPSCLLRFISTDEMFTATLRMSSWQTTPRTPDDNEECPFPLDKT